MINLEMSGVHFELDDKVKQYARRKIGRLDRFLSRSVKASSHGEVILGEDDGKPTNRFSCEVTLKLPHETLFAKAATTNIFAAIDAAEAKLQTQLMKYKTKYGRSSFHRSRRLLRQVRHLGKWPRRRR